MPRQRSKRGDVVWRGGRGSIWRKSPGTALTLSEEPYLQSLAEWEELKTAAQKPFSRISDVAQEWAGREFNLSLFLETIKRGLVREMIDQRHFDGIEQADALSSAQRDLDRNVNKLLVLENLLLQLTNREVC